MLETILESIILISLAIIVPSFAIFILFTVGCFIIDEIKGRKDMK
jgi:hypothetical protein